MVNLKYGIKAILYTDIIRNKQVMADNLWSITTEDLQFIDNELQNQKDKIKKLTSAINAFLTEFGMDENEYNKTTFKQARNAIAYEFPLKRIDPLAWSKAHGIEEN